MYYKARFIDKVRVPPKDFGGRIKGSLLNICRENYEGRMNEEYGVIIAITGIGNVGEGHVIPGDGSAYYQTEIEMLTYKPRIQEVTRGTVTEVTEFGAFVQIGPIEGLVHVSQIMDDYINYDGKLPGFIGKKTEKKLIKEDPVVGKIVTISMKGDTSNSKVGLTMRQQYLGKPGWEKMQIKEKKTKVNTKGESE